jgi:hypothetical protein
LEVFDDFPSDEVVLNNALEVFRGGGVIPNGFGVDYDDRALDTDSEAVGLAAMDHRFSGTEPEFLESAFEELPGGHAIDRITAFRFGRGGAQEDMSLVVLEIKSAGDGIWVGHGLLGIGKEGCGALGEFLVGDVFDLMTEAPTITPSMDGGKAIADSEGNAE